MKSLLFNPYLKQAAHMQNNIVEAKCKEKKHFLHNFEFSILELKKMKESIISI